MDFAVFRFKFEKKAPTTDYIDCIESTNMWNTYSDQTRHGWTMRHLVIHMSTTTELFKLSSSAFICQLPEWVRKTGAHIYMNDYGELYDIVKKKDHIPTIIIIIVVVISSIFYKPIKCCFLFDLKKG